MKCRVFVYSFFAFTLALSASAGLFSADVGLAKSRREALAPLTDRAKPSAVVWAEEGVHAPAEVFGADGKCARLIRAEGDSSAPAFALDFGKSSTEGWSVIRVKSAKGSPVLRLAYANYPDRDTLREHGDFNEEDRSRYMGRDVELPVLPANVNRHELYRIPGAGVYVAPMLMPQFRYMRVQLDTPGEVEIDSIEVVGRDVCDTSVLDGYFASSDPDVDRLWQIGVWTAQLATIKTTWALNAVEGRVQPRKLTKGSDVHLSAAPDSMPSEGSFSVKVQCGVNPVMSARAGVALLAADADNALLCALSENGTVNWVRRNRGIDNVLAESRFSAPLSDGRDHLLEIAWSRRQNGIRFVLALDGRKADEFDYFHRPHGNRLGFWSPKGWWASFDDLVVRNAEGDVVFSDGFDDLSLSKWEFERPDPFVSDGAKRDRLVWSGDLYWAGRNFYYAFGDCSLMRKTIGLLARNQTPEGYVHACPYAEQPPPKDGDYGPFESDEFAAWFIPVLHDYWRHTGDDGAMREFYPNVRRLLGYLERFIGKDGLFQQRFKTSKHAFAPCLQMGDVRHRSYMDILVWMCLRGGAEMAHAMGERADADKWDALAIRVREAAQRAYWDDRRGVFRDAVEDYLPEWEGEPFSNVGTMVKKPGSPEGTVAMEPNALAVESGFATVDQARRICPQLAAQSWVRKFILLSAIAKGRTGFGEDAWQTLSTNRWGVFSSPEWDGPWVTAEGMDPFRYGSTDQSHPDTAPAGFISSCFLGIVPLAPGFESFSFSPNPPCGMTFAEGRVPTKFGPIDARWERTAGGGYAFELTVPAGTRAEVVPPDGTIVEVDGSPGDGKLLGPGRHRLCARPSDKAALQRLGDGTPVGEFLSSLDPSAFDDQTRDALRRGDICAAVHGVASYFRNRHPLRQKFRAPSMRGAERAIAGEVEIVNIPWKFPCGRIDFTFNPTLKRRPHNPEWTWQLNRMGMWGDLAGAYEQTRDERYARAFVFQLRDWMAQCPFPEKGGWQDYGSAWRTIETGIRLMGPLPRAFDSFRKSRLMDDMDICSMLALMYRHAGHLIAHRTTKNWLLMEMNGAYAFAVHFPEFRDARKMRIDASASFSDAIRDQMLPDGLHYELSPDYHNVFWTTMTHVYDLALENGVQDELPPDFRKIIERCADGMLSVTTPGFVQPRANDCYTVNIVGNMQKAARYFPERRDFLWAASGRRDGAPPSSDPSASRLLPWSGFAAMRSSWEADATFVQFDFGPMGEGHRHQDKLNINLWKGDEELVFDDGGGQYDASEHRRYAVSGYDHNILLVDGLAQDRDGPWRTDKPIVTDWVTSPAHDGISAVYDQTFGPGRKRLADHVRRVDFHKPDVVIVTDEAKSADGKPHDYTLLFHLDTLKVLKRPSGALRADYGRKWDLFLMPLAGNPSVETVSGRTEPSLAGWFVGRLDTKTHPATTVMLSSGKSENHRFVTLLVPVRHGEGDPEVSVSPDGRLTVQCNGRKYDIPARDDCPCKRETGSQSVEAARPDAPGRQLGILTPPESASPRINGPAVFGVRPSSPILYRVPVTGERPMKIAVSGLPKGATFDSSTSMIGGSIAKRGEYHLVFTAENAHGRAERKFSLKVGDEICLTPPLGWNSWNCWGQDVTDEKMRRAADAMVSSGLADHGWSYVVVDDCWRTRPTEKEAGWKRPGWIREIARMYGPARTEDGLPRTNSAFPDMKAMIGYIHAKGLKAGLYSVPGRVACCWTWGSFGYEETDAATWADWGVDLLKYDWCEADRDYKSGNPRERQIQAYGLMGEILARQKRDIVYNVCNYGRNDVSKWAKSVGGHYWRTNDDLKDSWKLLVRSIDANLNLADDAGPGGWNDPDMLVVGPMRSNDFTQSRLTPNEQYAHMTLWAIMSSPLFIGCDLERIDPLARSLLTNDEVLEINQDVLGKVGRPVVHNDDFDVWLRPLADGAWAMAFFNRTEAERDISADFASLGLPSSCLVRCVWAQKDLGVFKGRFSASIPAHAALLYRLSSAED